MQFPQLWIIPARRGLEPSVEQHQYTQADRHHRLLLLNAFAQGAALMQGRSSDDRQRSYSGNRPSSTVLLHRLSLGG